MNEEPRPQRQSPSPGSQLGIGALLSYATMATNLLIALAFTPVVLRLLGPSEYGLYSLALSLMTYLAMLPAVFASGYLRVFARLRAASDDDGIARLNGAVMTVFAGAAALTAVAGSLLAGLADVVLGDQFTAGEIDRARVLFAVLTCSVVVSLLLAVFDLYLTARERFAFQRGLQLLRAVLNPILALPLLLLGWGAVAMVSAGVVLAAGAGIVTAGYCRRRLAMRLTFRGRPTGIGREILAFSSFIMLNVLADQVNWNADRFIVGWFHGADAVAVYSLAGLLNTYYLGLASAVSAVFAPRVNAIVASARSTVNVELSDLFIRVGRLQFAVLGVAAVFLVVLGDRFLELWAGPTYRDSYGIALLLILPVTIPLIQNVGIEIQRAKNMHRFRSWVYFGIALVNIAASIPLTRSFGGVGAAAATAATLLVGNGLVMNWYYRARVGLDLGRFWSAIARMLPALAPAVLVGLAVRLTIDVTGVAAFVGASLGLLVVAAASMWLLGLDKGERAIVRSTIRPLGRALIARRGA